MRTARGSGMASISELREHARSGPRPAPGRCKFCAGEVEPILAATSWVVPELCETCYQAAKVSVLEQRRRAKYEEACAVAGLPRVSKGWILDKWGGQGDAEALAAAEAWQFGPMGVYLWGAVGNGKTTLAFCLLKRELWRGQTGLFMSVPRWLSDKAASYGSEARASAELLEQRAERVGLLVLDDIGAEAPTDKAHQQIFGIIDSRLNNRRPTIYTSNLRPSRLDQHVGQRIASRVLGGAQLIRVNGPDFRNLAAKERAAKC